MSHGLLARLATGIALCLGAAVCGAEPVPVDQPPTWTSLSRAQQGVLAPLQRDWASIDAPRKQKWLEVARRFPTMPESERQRIQERMSEWARMSPAERGRARLQFQESRQLSAEDRQASWEAYRALPDDERRALAQRARKPAAKPSPAAEAQVADTTPKRNVVTPSRQAPVKTVAPTIVQAKPGATTTLLTSKSPPPSHQQSGLPKIAATKDFVDPNTLLPQRGPQGAAVQSAPGATQR
jgi:Protein of unknown function (DUF3106)